VCRLQEHEKRAAKHDALLANGLSETECGGFVLPSVSTTLSGYAFTQLQECNANSCFMRVCPVPVPENHLPPGQVLASWVVVDKRFVAGDEHHVSRLVRPLLEAGSEKARLSRLLIASLSKDPDLGKEKCSCCQKKELGADGDAEDVIGGFVLPAKWEWLYQTLALRKRLCLALGFGVPKEDNSTNNATAAGLTNALTEYAHKLESLQQGADALSFDAARLQARTHMREWKHGERPLGKARFSKDTKSMWLSCGLIGDEESLPDDQRRHYCGKWFHFVCAGLISKPKDKTAGVRVACMECLQDRRYRVKVKPSERLRSIALHDSTGVPRIVSTKVENEQLETWFLSCDCAAAEGSGLPCTGMCAVARCNAVVISFDSFHPHWLGSNILPAPRIDAAFQINDKYVLNVSAVIDEEDVEHRNKPGTFDADLESPQGVELNGDPFAADLAVEDPLQGVVAGPPVNSQKRSRAFKKSKKKSKE